MFKYIWIKGKKYYYYDTYNNKKDAVKEAQYWKKRSKGKCKRYILKGQKSGLFEDTVKYQLYLDSVIRLSFF